MQILYKQKRVFKNTKCGSIWEYVLFLANVQENSEILRCNYLKDVFKKENLHVSVENISDSEWLNQFDK